MGCNAILYRPNMGIPLRKSGGVIRAVAKYIQSVSWIDKSQHVRTYFLILIEPDLVDETTLMVDGTIIKFHQYASGSKRRYYKEAGRSRESLRMRVHAAAGGLRNPAFFFPVKTAMTSA